MSVEDLRERWMETFAAAEQALDAAHVTRLLDAEDVAHYRLRLTAERELVLRMF